MSAGSDPHTHRATVADRVGGRTTPARVWGRVPVAVRAVIVGFLVLVAGNFLPQGLLAANLKWPAVPWSAALIAAYLWLYWRYIGGRGWPRSTAAARRRDLRAVPLPPVIWRWSLAAGALGIAALTTMTYALGRLVPLGLDFPEVLERLPTATLVTLVLTISIMAGIVEESAFRGYMQSRLERRHGPVVAILVVSVFFVLAHLPTSTAALPRMGLIFIASIGYGILAYRVGSILPGLVLHAAGDVVGFGLLWLSLRGPSVAASPPPRGVGDPRFWANVVETVVLAVLTVWAFRRLTAASRATPRRSVVKDVGLGVLETRSDFELLERWVRSPHVVRWWGNPDLNLATLRERPMESQALITAEGRPVGYLCWQRPPREELEAAGLTDLPEDLVDIDILIGEAEYLGCGVGPKALALLLARLRGGGVGFAGVAASTSNHSAIRAYEKAGFRAFRDFQDPEAGACTYLVARLGDA